MNRVDLQNNIQNYFSNSVYYTLEDLNASIQDGLDEICAFTGVIYKTASIPFTTGKSYYDMISLLPDYIGVVAMYNPVIRRWMTPISLRKLDQFREDWETAAGTPWYFSPVNHRYVAIFRKPITANYGNFYIYYIAAAPLLDDNTPIPLPDDHITSALEEYCVTDLWEQNQEISKASASLSVYMQALEDLRVYIKNRRNSDRVMSLK